MRMRGKPLLLPRLRRLPFAVEVALAVLIKLLLLLWLWHTFFSAPQTKKMRLPTAQVEQHVLSTPLSTPLSAPQADARSLPHSFPTEAMHDSNR